MKKIGYTLAEVLIAMAVIAVIASIMLPLANKFRPDSNKVLYLKTYDAIVESVGKMAANPNLYPVSDGSYTYAKAPLYNLQEVELIGIKYGGSAKKFCELLGFGLSATGTSTCSDNYQEYSDNLFDNLSFTSGNGVQFVVTTNVEGFYQSDIYFDVNGAKGDNCMYSSSCLKPDRFKVSVAADGTVVAADEAGQSYLDKRSNWKKSELEPASLLASLPKNLSPEQMKNYEAPKQLTDSSGSKSDSDGSGGSSGEPSNPDPDEPGTPTTPDEPDDSDSDYVGMPCINEYTWAPCKGEYLDIYNEDLDEKMNWQDAMDACADLGLRLPTLSELFTINDAVKNGKVDGTKVTEYWTSSGYSRDPNKSQNGIIGGSYWAKGVENRATRRQVRCVK